MGAAPTFSGSYDPIDVTLLLRTLDIEPTPVDVKESDIQSGRRHYAQMVSYEPEPEPAYLGIYEAAMTRNLERMARDTLALAAALRRSIGETVTLVSLVRAGCPIGVLLRRALARAGVDVVHYGVSIVRGIGIDRMAMAHILSERPASSIAFIDGWTGKGAIAGQLAASLTGDLSRVVPRLAVLADPAGCAQLAASRDDWLIPSGIMGAVVSGLVSRTVVDEAAMRGEAMHGCRLWNHLREHDRSRDYVDTIDAMMVSLGNLTPDVAPASAAVTAAARSRRAVDGILARSGVDDVNRVKPGIAEATRAVLRRVPEHVFVRDIGDGDVAALVHLAEAASVPVIEDRELCGPYRAVTVIRKVRA